MIARVSKFVGLAVAGVFLAAGPAVAQDLTGAGATFPNPIYQSGSLITQRRPASKSTISRSARAAEFRQFTEGTVDFGASDAPMSECEIAKLKAPALITSRRCSARTHHLQRSRVSKRSTSTGPWSPTFFSGKITKWNARDCALNYKGVALRTKTFSSCIGLTQRHDVHLHRLSDDCEPRVGAGPGKGKDVAVAGGSRRKGERGGRWPSLPNAGRDRLRRTRMPAKTKCRTPR